MTLAVVVAVALQACGGDDGGDSKEESTTRTDASPATAGSGGFPSEAVCRKPAAPTPEQSEGPYYKSGPPERKSLVEQGTEGRRLLIRGRVLTTACRPVARARVDFWQADTSGEYDTDGYRLRGYQLTDGRGRYRVETIVPAVYEGRTRHIHVKVGPPGDDPLTTQLYFPAEPANQDDGIFVPETELRLRRGGAWRASFDFVVGSG